MVSTAIRLAEAKTDGEIAPMIVRQSARTNLLPALLLTLGCLSAACTYIALDFTDSPIEPYWIALAVVALSWPLSVLASKCYAVQRFFVHAKERESEVHRRALTEFYESGLHHTKNRTGVLIFVSLMERKCVVLADEGISLKLPAETWQNLVEKVLQGIRTGRPAEGLIAAIEECGRILSKHFPADDHQNQLPNELVIKE